MKSQRHRWLYSVLLILGLLPAVSATRAESVEQAATATVPVKMTVTVQVDDKKRMPAINAEDVLVKRGKERLTVDQWVPARGDRAGLELFILIDDASDWRLGTQLDYLRGFIKDQPTSTMVGVGYMRNTTVQILQDLTNDHVSAANAIRLPSGNAGAFASPYLSVMDMMKRWPQSENRHEVIMISDGLDRRSLHHGWHRGYRPSPDMDAASALAQKTGTNIHTIYAPGDSRVYRNFWTASSGQTNMARLSDATGGMSFNQGLHNAVSFAPCLADLQKAMNSQYLLSFSAPAGKKAGLHLIDLSTEVAGVDFAAHDAVWVPAAKH